MDSVRNPFRLPPEKVSDEYRNEFVELETDLSVQNFFDESPLTEFSPLMVISYPKVTRKAIGARIPFVLT